MDSRTAVISSLAVIAPETDFDRLASDADLRDELDLDSMDFLNFVIELHDRTGVEVPERDYPRDADAQRLRALPGRSARTAVTTGDDHGADPLVRRHQAR